MKVQHLLSAGLSALLLSHSVQADWQSVDQGIKYFKGQRVVDRQNEQLRVHVRVNNRQSATLEGPFRLLILNASHPILAPSGMTDDGIPYLTLSQEQLAPRQSAGVQVQFALQRAPLRFGLALQQQVTPESDWELVWQDEFEGPEIDTSKWGFEQNCWGGGNGEQQCYTDRPVNAFINNGVLNIVAQEESFTGPDNPEGDPSSLATLPYTSARLRTLNKGDWTYGRFEIRAKLPAGQGTWPAIWMLPSDYVYGSWAASGEIDIMEAVNLKTPTDDPNAPVGEPERRTYGTLHYGRTWPGNVSSGAGYKLPSDMNPADDFHVYALEWQQGEMRWYVDGVHFATQTDAGWYSQYQDENGQWQTAPGDAPFNERFHLLLNLAVGGAWSGNVNNKGIDPSVFPQTMEVDYVRVYECSINPATGEGCATIGDNPEMVPGNPPPDIPDPVENLGAGPVFNMYVNGLLEGLVFGSYNPDASLMYQEQDEAGRGSVLLVEQSGSVGNLYVNTDPALDLTHFAEYGQLVFDLQVLDNPGGSELLVKMDSGWPAVSDTSVALPPLGEWHTVRLGVAQLLANGNRFAPGNFANPASIVNPFVVESTGPMSFRLDNLRYEYSLDGLDEVVIFDDQDHAPFSLISYVASGNVVLEQVQSADASHGEVKQITFNTNESVVYFQTQLDQNAVPLRLDASAFDFVEFDLLVVNDERADRTFMMKMDCGHPCSSGDYPVDAPEIGVWTHFQIALSDLVSHPGSTLDLSRVDTPLVIFPAWGNQQGVVMQVDNVRLVSDGDDSNNGPTVVEVNGPVTVFDDVLEQGWSLWDCCQNANLSLVPDGDRTQVIYVDFFGPAATVSGLQTALPYDLTAVSGGTLEFDFKLVNPPDDAAALLLLKVEATDGTYAQFELAQSLEGATPEVGVWQHYTFPLTDLQSAGLNLSRVKLMLIFPEWDRAVGAQYQLDQVQILP